MWFLLDLILVLDLIPVLDLILVGFDNHIDLGSRLQRRLLSGVIRKLIVNPNFPVQVIGLMNINLGFLFRIGKLYYLFYCAVQLLPLLSAHIDPTSYHAGDREIATII